MSYATAAGFHESGLKSLPGNNYIYKRVSKESPVDYEPV